MSDLPEKPEFIEKVFQKKYFFFIICFIVFSDLLLSLSHGTHIGILTEEFVKNQITWGESIISMGLYLFFMLLFPKARFWIIYILWRPLSRIYVKNIELPLDPGYVSILELKNDAINTNNIVLRDVIFEREKRDKDFDLIDDLRFALGSMLIADLWINSTFAHSVLMEIGDTYKTATKIILSFFLIFFTGKSLVPFSYFDDSIYMPDHPIAKEQKKKRDEDYQRKRAELMNQLTRTK